MARITKAQKYAILWLHSNSMATEGICKELNLDEKQVNNIIKSNSTSTNSEDSAPTQQKKHTSKDLMITKSQSGNRSVAIMTKAASEMNDENKKNNSINNQTTPPHIYRPNG